jgi:hypothetical protein
MLTHADSSEATWSDVNHDPKVPSRKRRYEPIAVYALAERLKRSGVALDQAPGPWRPDRRLLRRAGRNGESTIPLVTNGQIAIAVDTAEHAVDLSGILNSAGVDHLDPIPNLRPPEHDLT